MFPLLLTIALSFLPLTNAYSPRDAPNALNRAQSTQTQPNTPTAPITLANATFTQLIDHKNPSLGTFEQFYYYSAQYWAGPGSPIVLFTPGEVNVSCCTDYATLNYTSGVLAQKLGAAVVIRYMPKNCSADLTRVVDHVDHVGLNGTVEEQKALQKMFGLEEIVHYDDFAAGFYTFCDTIEGIPQNQTQNQTSQNITLPPETGIGLALALPNYAKWMSHSFLPGFCESFHYPEWTGRNNVACLETYDTKSPYYTDWSLSNKFSRQWTWLTCNEPFGYWPTATPPDRPSIVPRLVNRAYWERQFSSSWASTCEEGQGSSRITSQIAGAFLGYSKGWAMTSYRIWSSIARLPNCYGPSTAGVRMRRSTFFFPELLEEQRGGQLDKMMEIKHCGASGFRHDVNLVRERGVNPHYGAKDAYEIDTPVIDTDVATAWLMSLVKAKGAQLVTEAIHGDLLAQEDGLCRKFGVGAIVNATGLSARQLASDNKVYPLRGALVRVHNDGLRFPKIECAMSISANVMPGGDSSADGHTNGNSDNGIVFLVPRNDNTLIIGGVAQENEWKLDLQLDSPSIQQMRKRGEAFHPGLENAIVDAEYPIAQGLRPARKGNVRVERELRKCPKKCPNAFSCIVHSYGHGGSGWSLSFGCAVDVCELVEEVLRGIAPMSMDERWRSGHQPVKITDGITD
ncbi:hypothetical protein EG327_006344 [Venturia inaequalis]|uniref:FAD dependent oxidoreductase domain-containing protein n=1 Tax=Venturia inaequalis TaxID=5025 RepID=A0A8H3V4F1_VENIN|nr:hypothetical protein EG327_006344 [Venturia inaequalis]